MSLCSFNVFLFCIFIFLFFYFLFSVYCAPRVRIHKYIGVMGLTYLIKLVRFLYLVSFLYLIFVVFIQLDMY